MVGIILSNFNSRLLFVAFSLGVVVQLQLIQSSLPIREFMKTALLDVEVYTLFNDGVRPTESMIPEI